MLVARRFIAYVSVFSVLGCTLVDGGESGTDTDAETTGPAQTTTPTATSAGSSTGNTGETTGGSGAESGDSVDESGDPSADESSTGDETTGPSDCQVMLEDVIVDQVIEAGCDVHVETEVFVTDGATLTIREGARLLFSQDAALRVGTNQGCQGDCTGRLVVEGTEDDPVLFTSAATSKGAGDWKGVQLGAFALAQTSLSHAVLEYAGSLVWGARASAIHIDDGPAYDFGRISVDNCETRNNAGPGMMVNFEENLDEIHPPFFASLTGNNFADEGEVSVYIDVNAAGELDASNTYAAPIGVYAGAYGLTHDSTWTDLGVPYRVLETLTVADYDGAVLTIESGVDVEFVIGAGLVIADLFSPGALRATATNFHSGASSPFEGDWPGIFFGNETVPSFLDGCTVEHAAGYGNGDGVISTQSPQISPRLDITNTTFANNAGVLDIDIEELPRCLKYAEAAAGNTFDLTPCL